MSSLGESPPTVTLEQLVSDAWDNICDHTRSGAELAVAGVTVALIVLTSPAWGPFWLLGWLREKC